MKKIATCLLMTIFITACQKNIPNENTGTVQGEFQTGKPMPPVVNANPVFAFEGYYNVNPNRSVPAIFVMDVTSANKTMVYSNFTNRTSQFTSSPSWSADGTKLCFTLNYADLYTLNISLVNGVPTGSNATKIGDGVAGGGSYKQGKWRPGANQIACVWKKTGDPDKIHLLTSGGGAASVLYTAVNTDWVIEEDIAFKSDGSNLAFSERQISTGNVFLKVYDLITYQVIKSIDLSQFFRIAGIDWARSSGSNIVAIETTPRCDNTLIGRNGMHQIFTTDISSAVPLLTLLRTDVGSFCFSPDDTKISVSAGLARICSVSSSCCASGYFSIRIYTISTQSFIYLSNNNGNSYDWKR